MERATSNPPAAPKTDRMYAMVVQFEKGLPLLSDRMRTVYMSIE
jgi:hypothetical protein